MRQSPANWPRRALFVLIAGLIAACQTPPVAPEPSISCTDVALGLQSRVGTPVSGIQAFGPDGRRILGPGDAATMDFVPGRLNLITDGAGNLTRAYCG